MSLDWCASYNIPLDIADFDGGLASLNGRTKLSVTGAELAWAAIMVGFPDHLHPATASGSGWVWALAHRLAVLQAHVDDDRSGSIVPSATFVRADGSEKTAISYYLGLFAAKVMAARLLEIPWLRHFDAFYLDRHKAFPRGWRPDLIGQSVTGHWYVIEAKGRIRGCRGRLVADAKDQARSFTPPAPAGAGIASIAHFKGSQWQVIWRDPEIQESRPLDEDEQRAVSDGYYGPVVRAVAEAIQSGVGENLVFSGGNIREYAVAGLPGLDAWVAVPQAAVAAAAEPQGLAEAFAPFEDQLTDTSRDHGRSEVDSRMPGRWPDEWQVVRDGERREWTLGLDGVAVRLGSSWTAGENRS